MKIFFTQISLFIFLLGQFLMRPVFAETQTIDSQATANNASALRELIEQKNTALRELQVQREALEKNLGEVNKSGNSLKKELQTINSNINQLNLAIKSNKLTVEKLNLELDSLKNDIGDVERNIENQKNTVVKLLIELQKKDRENILTMFLKNKSLTQTVAEAQSIITINTALATSASELKEFQYRLAQKLDSGEQKKISREIERTSLINRQYIVQDQKSEKQKILEQTKNQEKIYREQINELSKKQEAIGGELEKIEDQLRDSFDPGLLPIKRPGVLGYPVEDPRVSQPYGKTKFAERAYKTKFHNGVDFEARIGTPIKAVSDGKITAVGNNGRLQYGKFVLVEHQNNLATLYAHLSRYTVQKGDTVKKGDIIGYSGNSGYSTGPHIHLTVYWAPSVTLKSFPGAGLVPVGITIDPADYL